MPAVPSDDTRDLDLTVASTFASILVDVPASPVVGAGGAAAEGGAGT